MTLTLDIDAYKAANGHVPLIIGRTYLWAGRATKPQVKLVRATIYGLQCVVANWWGYEWLVDKSELEWRA